LGETRETSIPFQAKVKVLGLPSLAPHAFPRLVHDWLSKWPTMTMPCKRAQQCSTVHPAAAAHSLPSILMNAEISNTIRTRKMD